MANGGYERKPEPTIKHFRESRLYGLPSAAQIAERDWRRAQPRTIHMELLGDPEPGRSAFDMKQAKP
jgi:hypothetical protein